MTIQIPDPIAQQAGLDEKAALKELALTLFAQKRLSASQARKLCGAHFFEFDQWRNERGLPIREFMMEELESDLETLRSEGML
jgi:predicted HTH domain antitoxin